MLIQQSELWHQHLDGRCSDDPIVRANAEQAKRSAEELGKHMRVTLAQCHLNGVLPIKGAANVPLRRGI